MNPAFPTSLELSRELLALEAARETKDGDGAGDSTAASRTNPAVWVCEKLQGVLTAFAGSAGFRSLLTRALTLAKAQESSLAGVQVLEDGSLRGFEGLHTETGTRPTKKAERGAGGEILVAQLLELLVIFIGEPLTLQLVRSAWPDVRRSAMRIRTKDTP